MAADFKKGDRVSTQFGDGTIVDDYWAYKDRFTVKLDVDDGFFDFGSSSMRFLRESYRHALSEQEK